MAYRNGTYIAFHAEGNPDPTSSDIRYFNIMKAWHEHDDIEFKFVNSHAKLASVKDTSSKQTLKASLSERMRNSKNFLIIIGNRTRFDTDWVPFEIEYASDKCGLPFIVVYTGYTRVLRPELLASLWPAALRERINHGAIRALHTPFQRRAIDAAIRRYDLSNMPDSSLDHWTAAAHDQFGITR